jgi:hypothetical protein
VEFTWDERKNRVNQRKHGISFETAISVFDDPFQVSRQDRVEEGEARWQTIGMVANMHILLVAHSVEEDDSMIPNPFSTKGDVAGEKNPCPGLLKP